MSSTIPTFAAAPKPLSEGRVFNDDLLMNPGDLQFAKDQFPVTFHILDHPELRNTFATYEQAANKARAWVRGLGVLAVASGTVALLSAATEPLWHDLEYENAMSIVFELFGLAAAVIAGGSLWLGPWRKRWLEARFMTERLRQWHFQLLVRKGGEIEASLLQSNPKAPETFRTRREKWFDDFLHEFEGKLDSRMDSLANDPDFSSDWLLNRETNYSYNSQTLTHVFEAYRRLRFNHQYDYATHKLSGSKDKPFWQFLKWPPLRQESAIRAVVSFCFIGTLLCAVGVIVNRYFEIRPGLAPYFDSTTLAIAVVGVAFRTIQEGLGITKDIERYRDYRGKVRRLLLYFDDTTDQQKRLKLMEEMELAVVDELRGFLRTHREAAFLL